MRKTFQTGLGLLACCLLLSCGGGGGDDGGSSQNNGSSAASASTEGLWQGTMHSSVTNRDQNASLLVLPNGETRLVAANCVQYVATTSVSSDFFSGSGRAFAPDGGIAACPVAYTFPNGGNTATVSVSGQVATRQTLYGSYSAGGDTGTFRLNYDTSYGRVGTLERIAGSYSNGTVQLTIGSNGSFTGMLGPETIFGNVTTIDVSKNAYRITVYEGTPATAATASASAVAADITSTWSGTATLTDYSSSTDNALTMSLTNSTGGFATTVIRQ